MSNGVGVAVATVVMVVVVVAVVVVLVVAVAVVVVVSGSDSGIGSGIYLNMIKMTADVVVNVMNKQTTTKKHEKINKYFLVFTIIHVANKINEHIHVYTNNLTRLYKLPNLKENEKFRTFIISSNYQIKTL